MKNEYSEKTNKKEISEIKLFLFLPLKTSIEWHP